MLSLCFFQLRRLENPREEVHECCDYHAKLCKCEDCLLSDMASLMDPPFKETPTQACCEGNPSPNLTAKKKSELHEELVNFRLSQPGHGRTTVGSTSLSSGVTIKLIGEIVDKAHTFSSAADIEKVYRSSATIMLFLYGILLNSTPKEMYKHIVPCAL